MTSSSVLDVYGSESPNDGEPALDIRSTDPWRGFPRHLERLQVQVLEYNGVPRTEISASRLSHKWGTGASSRRKFEAMTLWFLLSETSEMGARERNVQKRANRNIEIRVLRISTISLMMQYPCRVKCIMAS
jgi:hypothetical protein